MFLPKVINLMITNFYMPFDVPIKFLNLFRSNEIILKDESPIREVAVPMETRTNLRMSRSVSHLGI